MLREIAASANPVPLPDLAVRLGYPTTTASRIAATLVEEGLVVADGDGRLALGIGAARLAALLKAAVPFETIVRPILRAAVAETGETVSISRYLPERGMSMIAAIEDSGRSLSYVLELGELKQLNAGATGKSILAFLPPKEIDAIIDRYRLPAVTRRTTTDRAKLMRELAQIRENGFAMTRGERIAGAVGIAAPIFREAGQVFGCIGVTTPEYRFRVEDKERFARAVMAAAASLSQLVSGRDLGGTAQDA